MGIIVPEATLPSGIRVSNVYMSFSGELVYVYPRNEDGRYTISAHYKVYVDSTKNLGSNIKIPISVTEDNITGRDVYSILYENLKKVYIGYLDIENALLEVSLM